MDTLILLLVILAALGLWAYKWGKRIGSQKGFGVGRSRGRRRRR